tara:strand:- start:314 stop:508 length:195 start_codon:yes stop_codon:yes gene_type:complete
MDKSIKFKIEFLENILKQGSEFEDYLKSYKSYYQNDKIIVQIDDMLREIDYFLKESIIKEIDKL